MRTLRLYVLRELVAPVLISICFFTAVLLIVRLFDLADLILKTGIGGSDLLQLVLIVVGTLVTMTVPMAVLLGTLIGVGRLTGENEILAIRAGGINVLKVFAPVGVAGLAISVLLMWTNLYVIPGFFRQIDDLKYSVQYDVITSLQPGVFYNDLGSDSAQLSLFYETRQPAQPGDGPGMLRMRGVNLRIRMEGDNIAGDEPAKPGSSTSEYLIFAESGTIEGSEQEREIRLALENGQWLRANDLEKDETNTILFKRLENVLEHKADDSAKPQRDARLMGPAELVDWMARPPTIPVLRDDHRGRRIAREWRSYFSARNELIQRFTLPLATVAFVLIALPLAMEIRPRAKSISLLIAIGLMMVYYGLLVWGASIGSGGAGWLATIFMLMLPNLVVGGVGCLLLRRSLMR